MLLCLGTTPTAQRTLVFERVAIDAVNRAIEVHEHASGKSVNVARVAHALGERVLAMGFLGGDRGTFVRHALDQAGIAHRFVTVAPQTRLCTTVVDRSNRTATELVEDSAAVTHDDWGRMSESFAAAVGEASMCVMSGSLPSGGPSEFYADCIAVAQKASCRVILDTSGEPLRRAMAIPGLILKLNRGELALTTGSDLSHDSSLREAMHRALPPGGSIIVTMGAAGAIAHDGRDFWTISSPRVQTISAIGSGDAFAAGLAVALMRGQSLRDACILGAACGAANAETALSGYVDAARVPALLSQVRIT